jgi:protein MAK16
MKNRNEELIWSIIGGDHFCSYKQNHKIGIFCKNSHNLTGLCNRQSCPLSNSAYATIVEKEGAFYLIKKDPYKLSFPKQIWKKIPLSRNFRKAIQEININLSMWPKFFLHFAKLKLIKLVQISVRFRVTELKKTRDFYEPENMQFLQKEKPNLNISKINLESIIEKELLNRLNLGIYGNLYPKTPLHLGKNSFEEKTIEKKRKKNNYEIFLKKDSELA